MRHPVHVRLILRTADHNDDTLQHCSIQSTYDSLYGLLTTTTTCSSIAESSQRTTRGTGLQPYRHPPVNPIYFKNRDIDLPTSTNASYSPRSFSCLSTTSTNTSYLPRSSSCLSTPSTLPATDINHLADDINNNPRTYIRHCKLDV